MAWTPSEPQGGTEVPVGAQYIRNNFAALETALGADLNCGLYRASNASNQAKMWFYRDTAPTGWAIEALLKDALLGIKADTTAYTVTAFTNASQGVITLDTSSHGFAVGHRITVSGITDTGSGTSLNGNYTVASVLGVQVTVSTDTSAYNVYSSGGQCAMNSSSTYITGGSMKGTWQQEGHQLTIDEIPAHTHSYTLTSFIDGSSGGGSRAGPSTSGTTGSTGGGAAHDHGLAWRPYAAIGIVCSRS